MSVVDPQIPEPASSDENQLISPVTESPHAEYDADQSMEAITSTQSEPGDHNTDLDSVSGDLAVTDLDENGSSNPAAGEVKATSKDIATTRKKGTMSVSTNPRPGKANGDPPTPLVKKIINSGTFGAGAVKPAPPVKSAASGGATGSKTPSASAPPLKKPATSAPSGASASKPTMPSRTPAAPPPAASRRASVVPAKHSAPATTRNLLSTSLNAKPAPDPAKARASVASPTGSVTSAKGSVSGARPRASISETARKPSAPSKSTTNATGRTTVTKPATTRAPITKSSAAHASASIPSIKELKEDNKAVEELQGQLKEAGESLKAKEESVTALEAEVERLQAALQSAHDDVESKRTLAAELEEAKAALEVQLKKAQESASDLAGQREEHDRLLQQVKDELESAKLKGSETANEVEKLRVQITELEETVAAAESNLKAVAATHAAVVSDASKASSVHGTALSQAQSDLKAISAEAESLKSAYAEAVQNASAMTAELEGKSAELVTLQSQIDGFRLEKEETAGKVSELEIEVLELKEQIEELEDAQDRLQTTVKTLQAEIDKSAKVLEESTKVAHDREADLETQVEGLKLQHDQDLKAAAERYNALHAALRALEDQLATALAAQEKSAQDLVAAQIAHDEHVKNLEEASAAKEAELNLQIATISKTLSEQEAIYADKVQIVKDEHQTLLKEAFERAKAEAATAHTQELQALRAESNATIAQIQEGNKLTLESLTSDHTSTLESTIKDYSKQLSNLNLELRATTDDLAKAKATSDALRTELETASKQLNEARAAVGATPTISPEHLEEVARLTRDLSNTKDDLAAVTDMLNLTRSSLTEMSEKHQKDLEGAAQGRAEEVLGLNAAHDAEISALAIQKSELLIRLSDLESELATVKAALNAAETASPKTNGAAQQHPASPSVTQEDLAKLHEAHTLKIYDLQAEHEKAMKALKEDHEAALRNADQLQQDVARKAMEIQYLEQEQEESSEQITRLKEDLEALTERCAKEHSTVVA